jgi:SAM-dependent methyltransferase
VDYQDVLAEVGAGSAHPGGMAATRLWMDRVALTPEHTVLEVGCGTGCTLVQLHQRFGCRVAGVDIRPAMIEKAKRRLRRMGVAGDLRVASALDLPFDADRFDLVYTESVNVFLDALAALREYYRVLKPGGAYVDIEMMLLMPADEVWREAARRIYGTVQVPGMRGWKHLYREAGFREVQVIESRPVRLDEVMDVAATETDELDLATPGAFERPEVAGILMQNADWMERYHRMLGFAVFRCRK